MGVRPCHLVGRRPSLDGRGQLDLAHCARQGSRRGRNDCGRGDVLGDGDGIGSLAAVLAGGCNSVDAGGVNGERLGATEAAASLIGPREGVRRSPPLDDRSQLHRSVRTRQCTVGSGLDRRRLDVLEDRDRALTGATVGPLHANGVAADLSDFDSWGRSDGRARRRVPGDLLGILSPGDGDVEENGPLYAGERTGHGQLDRGRFGVRQDVEGVTCGASVPSRHGQRVGPLGGDLHHRFGPQDLTALARPPVSIWRRSLHGGALQPYLGGAAGYGPVRSGIDDRRPTVLGDVDRRSTRAAVGAGDHRGVPAGLADDEIRSIPERCAAVIVPADLERRTSAEDRSHQGDFVGRAVESCVRVDRRHGGLDVLCDVDGLHGSTSSDRDGDAGVGSRLADRQRLRTTEQLSARSVPGVPVGWRPSPWFHPQRGRGDRARQLPTPVHRDAELRRVREADLVLGVLKLHQVAEPCLGAAGQIAVLATGLAGLWAGRRKRAGDRDAGMPVGDDALEHVVPHRVSTGVGHRGARQPELYCPLDLVERDRVGQGRVETILFHIPSGDRQQHRETAPHIRLRFPADVRLAALEPAGHRAHEGRWSTTAVAGCEQSIGDRRHDLHQVPHGDRLARR